MTKPTFVETIKWLTEAELFALWDLYCKQLRDRQLASNMSFEGRLELVGKLQLVGEAIMILKALKFSSAEQEHTQ